MKAEIDGSVFRYRTNRRFDLKLDTLELKNPFVLRFINAQDDDSRADFFGQFGFLEEDQSECTRRDVLQAQSKFRKRLTLTDTGDPADVTKALAKRADDPPDWFVPTYDGQRLLYKVSSLAALMRMEIAMILEKGASLAACEYCSVLFLTGPTTGRRSHARYCSDKHRVAALRARTVA